MSQNPPPAAPDVRQLGQQTLPESAFPGGHDQAFRVWFRPEAHEAVLKHAAENSAVEICGVLVGKWAKDADGPYLTATEIIRGEAATSKFAEVTFTHDTWARINHEMDTRFGDLSIVGWYHSHPDFGIFLSDRDRFIQENFFSGAGQVALVVDPVRKTEGVFVWQKGKPALAPLCWVGNSVRAATAAGSETPPPAAAPGGAPGGSAPARQAPADEVPAWVSPLARGAMYVLIFLVGYLLSGMFNRRMTELERLRIEQSTLARSLVYFNIRPGLDRELDEVNEDLRDVFKQAKTLAESHVKEAEDKDEVKKDWEAVLGKLARSSGQVRKVRIVYTLTPGEIEALLQRQGGKELPEPVPFKKKDEGKTPATKESKDSGKKDGGSKTTPGKDVEKKDEKSKSK